MTRGRPVDGSRRLRGCDGSDDAKLRAETVLSYLGGKLTADAASAQLGIGPSRFHEIVRESLKGLVEANEPAKAGRPSETTETDERVAALEEKVSALERQLELAKLLAENPWLPRYRRPPPKP